MATLTEQLANIDKSSLDNGSLFSFQIMFDAKKFETLFKSLYTVVVEQAKIIDNLKSTFMTKTEFKTEIQDAKIEIQLLFEDEFRRMDKDIIATKEMNANVGERLGDLDKKIRSHEKSFDDKITTIDQKFDQKLQDAIHDTLSKAGQSNMKALQTQVNERIDQLYNLLELTEESSAKAENDQNANTNHENTAIPNASNQEQITEHQTVNPDIVGMPTKSGSDNTSPISDVEPVLKSLKLSKQPQTAFMSGQKQNSTISDLVIVSSARGPAPRNDDSNSSLLSPDAFNKQRSAIKPEENNAQAKLDSYKRSLKIKTLSKEDIESILEQQQPKEFPEVKAALEETKKMREELALTNKKFSEMKKTVKQKILETIDKKNQEMFEEKFEPFKTRVENMMADKITGDDMNAMLSKKADVMDLNKKPDSETVFRAVKQLEVDVMTKIDQTIIQTDAKLTEKVDKEELNNILSQKFGIPPNMMANAGNGNPILMPQGANLPGGMANQNQLLPRLDLMGQQLESSLPSLSDNRGNNNYPMDLSSELCFCCGTPLASVKNRGAPIPGMQKLPNFLIFLNFLKFFSKCKHFRCSNQVLGRYKDQQQLGTPC